MILIQFIFNCDDSDFILQQTCGRNDLVKTISWKRLSENDFMETTSLKRLGGS